jgi:hypothetical protein
VPAISKPLSPKVHLRIPWSLDRDWQHPAQQCRLFPMPSGVGGYGSEVQPVVGRKRTLVRRQVQNGDGNRQDWAETKRSQMGVKSGQLYQMPGQTAPHGSGHPWDKEKARRGQGPFDPAFQDKRHDLSCQFRWRKPNGQLVNGLLQLQKHQCRLAWCIAGSWCT